MSMKCMKISKLLRSLAVFSGVIASLTFIFCSITSSFAQDIQQSQKQDIVVKKPLSINLTLLKEPEDQRGTDVTNIYNIKVDYTSPESVQNQIYDAAYFVDGRLAEEFKSRSLPFTLKRNFKGLVSGTHEIKIEILDSQEQVLAAKTVTLEVVH